MPLGFIFWEAEIKYVNNNNLKFEQEVINSYLSLVGAGVGQNVPLFLCAILFSIYCKGSDIEPQILGASFEKNILTPYLTSSTSI